MKKFISLILVLALFLCLVGCKEENDTAKSQEVIINMPDDDTVNGYRTESVASDSLPNTIDGSSVAAGDVQASKPDTVTYYANKNSKVFHTSDCSSVKNMKQENCVYFNTREECINDGYSPCKRCNP